MSGIILLAFFAFMIIAVVRAAAKGMRVLKTNQQNVIRKNNPTSGPATIQQSTRAEVATLENWLRAQSGAVVTSTTHAAPPPLPPSVPEPQPDSAPEPRPSIGSMVLEPIDVEVEPVAPVAPVVRPKTAAPATTSRAPAERKERRPDPVSLQTRPARSIASPTPMRSDASSLERALAKAIDEARADSAPGPSLALSSSLVRPLAHLYSVVALIASPSVEVARKSLGRVAASSRFFGLSLADEADLDEARLRAACSALRRSDGVFEEAIERDFQVLDSALGGAASTTIQRLRGLLQ